MPMGKSKAHVKREVNSGRFPPYICHQILYNVPEERRVKPAFLQVDLIGADVPLTFICRFKEAKSGCPDLYCCGVHMCVHYPHVCIHLHSVLTMHSPIMQLLFLQCSLSTSVQQPLCTTTLLTLLREQLVINC